MTIDHKALVERINEVLRKQEVVAQGPEWKAWLADLRTLVSLLEGMAEEKPVAWMRPDNRVREESFTGTQFSRGEQRPPIGTWMPLYLHPASQPAKEQRAGGGPGAMIGRELLELAASAAGDPIEAWTADADFVPVAILRSGARWQPLLKNRLTDCMGDALRLAVTLELDVLCASVRSAEDDIEVTIQAGVDPYIATRRAIVRTAAMLAKELK